MLPVPVSWIDCVAGLAFSALSVRMAELWIEPPAVGVKLMLRLQLLPGASEKTAAQSAGVPEPSTCAKFAPMLKPGAMALSVPLPIFSTVTDCGLSPLVVPTVVAGKVEHRRLRAQQLHKSAGSSLLQICDKKIARSIQSQSIQTRNSVCGDHGLGSAIGRHLHQVACGIQNEEVARCVHLHVLGKAQAGNGEHSLSFPDGNFHDLVVIGIGNKDIAGPIHRDAGRLVQPRWRWWSGHRRDESLRRGCWRCPR